MFVCVCAVWSPGFPSVTSTPSFLLFLRKATDSLLLLDLETLFHSHPLRFLQNKRQNLNFHYSSLQHYSIFIPGIDIIAPLPLTSLYFPLLPSTSLYSLSNFAIVFLI